MQNTLTNALENLDSSEPVLLLEELYADRGIGVTAWREGQALCIAVGFEGSSDVVYEGPDTDAAAAATMAAIAECDD
jgi:hypothetical protein